MIYQEQYQQQIFHTHTNIYSRIHKERIMVFLLCFYVKLYYFKYYFSEIRLQLKWFKINEVHVHGDVVCY